MELREVVGFERYLISSGGEVFRKKKMLNMKVTVSNSGYYIVGLINNDGKHKTVTPHRLVALAFIDNPENKPQVNHIDGSKLNNKLDNLEWCTPSENGKHAYEKGLSKPQYSYSDEFITKVCKALEDGERSCDIASRFNISRSLVSQIRLGKSWSHISNGFNIKASNNLALSDNTVKWVCMCLESGLTVAQIRNKTTNQKLTTEKLNRIRTGRYYSRISKEYNFNQSE